MLKKLAMFKKIIKFYFLADNKYPATGPSADRVYRPLPPDGNPIAVNKYHINSCQDITVGIQTRYMFDDQWVEQQWWQDIFSSPYPSIPVLDLNQFPLH